MEWKYLKGISIEAQYLYRKGMEMEEKGKHTAALAYFSQAVLLAPCYAKAVLEMGNCLASMGRFEEARVKFQKAAALDPLCATGSCITVPASGQPEQGL